jgi:hypothetical protein
MPPHVPRTMTDGTHASPHGPGRFGTWPTTIAGVTGPAVRKPGLLLRGGAATLHASVLTAPGGVPVRRVATRPWPQR